MEKGEEREAMEEEESEERGVVKKKKAGKGIEDYWGSIIIEKSVKGGGGFVLFCFVGLWRMRACEGGYI